MIMKAPCKGCEKRLIGCHALCPEFREFRKKLEEQKTRETEELPILSEQKKKYLFRRMLGR
jgi:hypothetical protein